MKGKLLVLVVWLLMLLPPSAMADEPVYFSDVNLKAAVEGALGISDPTQTDLLSLTELNANSRGIVDLTGIEYATNLIALRLYNNQVSDISALSGLMNLTVLWLSNNEINDISALSGLTNLTVLWLNDNQISDISPVSDLINLTSLELNYNQASDISAVSGLLNLGSLELYDNHVSDISAVSGLINLTWLWLKHNQISNVSPLSGLTNLATLDLISNQVSDISPLSGLTNLSILHLKTNPLNKEAYCIYLGSIKDNNPGIGLSYDPNPFPPEECLDDDVPEDEDNCPLAPNGPLRGTCIHLFTGNYIVNNGHYCTEDTDCDPGEYCEKSQADNYPPGGNSIGDACDCEGDFDCDGNVDGTDTTAILIDFGRSQYNYPCSSQNPCSGDIDCNGAVDADDVIKFLEDFARSQYNNPCPGCVPGQWCSYP